MMRAKTIIILSTADWSAPYLTNKQHMALHLAARGFNILYIESVGLRAPSLNGRDLKRVFRRIWRAIAGIQPISSKISVLSCLAIPFGRRFKAISQINQKVLRWQVGCYLKKNGVREIAIWAYHPYFDPDGIVPGGSGPLIYHCVDDLTAVPGVDVETFRKAEIELAKRASFIFVTSPILYENLIPHNTSTYYLPNVVDFEHFADIQPSTKEPQDLLQIGHPRIGYIGALSDFKVDFELISQISQRRLDWNWVIIGDEREGQRCPEIDKLRQQRNVFFLGHKDYSTIPAYLKYLDVATLPSLINQYTSAMFPMKLYEYIASGCRVVATDLPALRHINNMAIEKSASVDQFEQGLLRALKRGRLTEVESRSIVGENTWEARLDKMLNIMNWKDVTSDDPKNV